MNMAYIVCGRPGAGKTTYGKRLTAEKGAVFLDIDMSTERLVRLALGLSGNDPDDRDSTYFKQRFRQPIYEQLFDIARDNLAFNHVVITGPFTRELKDATWKETLSRRLDAAVEIHYVHCPPGVLKKRLLARANDRDRAKIRDWDSYEKYYGTESPPAVEHIWIESVDSQDKEK